MSDRPDTFVYLCSRSIERGQDAAADIINNVGGDTSTRIEVLQMDVSDDTSVTTAATTLSAKIGQQSLYAIVNNAGIGFGSYKMNDVLQTNTYGPHRVTEAFLPMLHRTENSSTTGRIVNITSASGPNFVAKMTSAGIDVSILLNPLSTWTEVESFMENVKTIVPDIEATPMDVYGLSKACVNAYTMQTARAHPDLVVNSLTPGFIDTDLTKGYGASLPPSAGTTVILYCLFGENVGTGRYYGSDAKRSPLDRYRGPGEPPYDPESEQT